MATQAEKAARFRALHERSDGFVIPNPWDAGSARLLEGLGFEALATTSSGFAQTLGRLDGNVDLEEKLAHCRVLCAASSLPISADLENGFADAPEEVAETVRRAAESGVVGGSIEDYSGNAAEPIYPFALAVERVQAAAEAAHSLDFPFTLTARAENLLHGVTDLDDTIRRLQAFAEAGADVLYAPGLSTLDQVARVAAEVDKPINVLAPFLRGPTVAEILAAGARRVSVGGALANVALGSLLSAARALHDEGSMSWLSGMASRRDLQKLLG